MRPTAPRIRPLPTADFTDAQARVLGSGRGDPINELHFVRTLVQHLDLYKRFVPFARGLVSETSLSPRHREILTLRTLALTGEHYESGHHDQMACDAGLVRTEIEAARAGGAGLESFERRLAQAAEELVRTYCLSDATWAALARQYTTEQMIELHFTVGNYVLMSMLTISVGMQSES